MHRQATKVAPAEKDKHYCELQKKDRNMLKQAYRLFPGFVVECHPERVNELPHRQDQNIGKHQDTYDSCQLVVFDYLQDSRKPGPLGFVQTAHCGTGWFSVVAVFRHRLFYSFIKMVFRQKEYSIYCMLLSHVCVYYGELTIVFTILILFAKRITSFSNV